MDNGDNIDSRWAAFGELLVWIVFFFWAVWLFDVFLPPKSDQTGFETYLSRMMGQPNNGAVAAPSRMPDTQDPGEQKQGPGGGWR